MRRQLGGVSSRKNLRVSRRALAPVSGLGDIAEYTVQSGGGGRRGQYLRAAPLGGVPDWYRQMQGTTLGDDSIGAMTEAEFRREMLSNQKALLEAHKHWADGDKLQKWIAIGATLSIPLAAAIWKLIFGVDNR